MSWVQISVMQQVIIKHKSQSQKKKDDSLFNFNSFFPPLSLLLIALLSNEPRRGEGIVSDLWHLWSGLKDLGISRKKTWCKRSFLFVALINHLICENVIREIYKKKQKSWMVIWMKRRTKLQFFLLRNPIIYFKKRNKERKKEKEDEERERERGMKRSV